MNLGGHRFLLFTSYASFDFAFQRSTRAERRFPDVRMAMAGLPGMLVVTFATATTLDLRMTVIAFRIRGTLVMLLALGTTIVVISTFGTGFRLALLLAWHTLLFRKLRGLLLSRPPAIVGIAVIAVVPTLVRRFVLFVVTALLLMQARVLSRRLLLRFSSRWSRRSS